MTAAVTCYTVDCEHTFKQGRLLLYKHIADTKKLPRGKAGVAQLAAYHTQLDDELPHAPPLLLAPAAALCAPPAA